MEGVHASLLASLPAQNVVLEYAGNTATGVKSVDETAPELDEEGRMSNYKFSVRIKADDLPGVDVQRLVTISGTVYQVLGKKLDQTGATLRVDFGDQHA